MALIDFVFPKLRTLKTWLDKCLKSPDSDDILTRNMVNRPKYWSNLHHSTFIIFIITVNGIEFEKVSLFDMPNFATPC